MSFWIIAIVFFAITFAPRFFSLMNFGYGFSNLGLYTETLSGFSLGSLNPAIATFGQRFFELKSEPAMILLWPVSWLTTSPSVFLFVDEAAMVAAAALCARYALQKTRHRPLALAIFFSLLLTESSFDALRTPVQIALWAQVPLVLLMTEYFQSRGPQKMSFYFLALCAVDLHFFILGLLLGPMVLLTQSKRWNLRRRLEGAVGLICISVISFWALHLLNNSEGLLNQFYTPLYWQVHGRDILISLTGFCFLPLLSLEACLVGLTLLCLRIGGAQEPIILFGATAIATVNALEILDLKANGLKTTFASCFASIALYFGVTSPDPYFKFWQSERWTIAPANHAVHDMLAKIDRSASVAASDTLTPLLANRLNGAALVTLTAVSEGTWAPEYVISRNENTRFDHDRRYSLIENNVATGTRLLKRNK